MWDKAFELNPVFGSKATHYPKGKGTATQTIDLPSVTVAAVADWLETRGERRTDAPLFSALDFANNGHRLTGEAMRYIVDKLSQASGITKKMSPHRIRHSSITAALDATGGNLRQVQKLSRHADPRTLMIYDDNRAKDQQKISDLLADMV